MDARAAADRFLASPALSEATRRAYGSDVGEFCGWLEDRDTSFDRVDVRVLSEYVAWLGGARGHEKGGRKLAPATISRKLAAVRAFLRHALGPERVPDARLGPRRARRLPDAPAAAEIERTLEALEGEGPVALRNRALVELVYSAGLRSAEAVGLDLGDVDFEQELVHVRRGKGGKDRVVPLGEEAQHWLARYLRGARPATRHEHAPPHRPAPAPAASCVRDAPPRGRRRPPDDSGVARPQLPLDDADLQPRRPAPPAAGVRQRASALVDSSHACLREGRLRPPRDDGARVGLAIPDDSGAARDSTEDPTEVLGEHSRPAAERRPRGKPARRRRRLPAREGARGDLDRRRDPRAGGPDRDRSRRSAGRARVHRPRDPPPRHLARAAVPDARRPRADHARGPHHQRLSAHPCGVARL